MDNEPHKESSEELSALAGKYLQDGNLSGTIYKAAFDSELRNALAKDIKRLAASVLSQDETHG